MKVKDFIKLLEKEDPNAELVLEKHETYMNYPVHYQYFRLKHIEIYNNSYNFLVDVERQGRPDNKKTEIIKAIKIT